MTGVTRTGFTYEIDDDLLDDFELIEKVRNLEKHPTSIPEFIEYALGKDQMDKLKEHCRNENGRVSSKRMSEEMKDILEGNEEVKK